MNASGVIDFYNDLSNFKQKIKDHLSLHIQQNEYIQTIVNELTSTIRQLKHLQNKLLNLVMKGQILLKLASGGQITSSYLGGQS